MKNIYFTQDPTANIVKNFYDYMSKTEKNYDQDKIIEWINDHEKNLGDKKTWLLTGQAYDKSYDEWEKWLIDNKYEAVIDCRGFGQVLWGEPKFHYNRMKKRLESKGITVFNLYKD